jgi:hypothetical protein
MALRQTVRHLGRILLATSESQQYAALSGAARQLSTTVNGVPVEVIAKRVWILIGKAVAVCINQQHPADRVTSMPDRSGVALGVCANGRKLSKRMQARLLWVLSRF